MEKFILIKENFLTNFECKTIVDNFKEKTEKETKSNGINYAFFEEKDYETFSFLKEKIFNFFQEYCKLYPQINFTKNKWAITEFRFKHFKPGNYFKDWHSEHEFENNKRILCLQIYLSDHNCGTEFYEGITVMSKKGKAVLFPAYFTHTHRGQPCPEFKDRYLIGGYAVFTNQ